MKEDHPPRWYDIRDLTLTFAGSRYPRNLLAHLQEIRGYTLDENWPGIYTIKGDIILIQVITPCLCFRYQCLQKHGSSSLLLGSRLIVTSTSRTGNAHQCTLGMSASFVVYSGDR